MAIVAAVLIDSPKKLWIFLSVLALAEGYSAYRINEQYFEYGYSLFVQRPWGTKGDNNLFSNLTVPLIFCSGSICVFADRYIFRFLFGFCLPATDTPAHVVRVSRCHACSRGRSTCVSLVHAKNKIHCGATFLALVVGVALAGPPVVKEFLSSLKNRENEIPLRKVDSRCGRLAGK